MHTILFFFTLLAWILGVLALLVMITDPDSNALVTLVVCAVWLIAYYFGG